MPATSVRDLLVKDNDLISATHGRGFWIMDDITPLRQVMAAIRAGQPAMFAPETAMRVRWDTNTDTPIPPDEPAGQNPPDGAMLDYFLPASYNGPVALEIRDASGAVVRRYSSDEAVSASKPNVRDVDAQFLDIPTYWIRPIQKLSAAPGAHRFLWDMHIAPLKGLTPQYSMAAVAHDTGIAPTGPWAMPGNYTVALIAAGKTYTQPLVLRMDPRVKTPAAELTQQFQLSDMLYKDLQQIIPAARQAKKMLAQQRSSQNSGSPTVLQSLVGAQAEHGPGFNLETLAGVQAAALHVMEVLQGADATPTTQAVQAAQQVHRAAQAVLAKWQNLKK